MVYAYVGLPGSGKTLSSLALLLSELRACRHVFTNISGLNPFLIVHALNRGAKRGMEYNLTHVDKFLHRFTLSYDVLVDGALPDGNAAPVPVPAVSPAYRSVSSARRSGVSPASAPSPVPAMNVNPSRVLVSDPKKYRIVRKSGITDYYNSEGLSLLIKDVMGCNETVVILDECHEYLNPENFNALRPFVKYISMARHYGHDLILITQHITDIWGPIHKRVHETHEFFRGQLGIRTHYKERVYYGSNVLASPGYVRQRKDDKSLYCIYQSHVGGVKEHMPYMSLWKNGRILFLGFVFLCVFVMLAFVAPRAFAFISGKANPVPVAVADSVSRYSHNDNVVYVKYVVCGHYDCKATRPDGSIVTLPLDYASGRYPLEVRKYVPQGNNSYYPSATNGGGSKAAGSAGGGVPNARR